MNVSELLGRMDEKAQELLPDSEPGPVQWGNYSSRVDEETGVKAQSCGRWYYLGEDSVYVAYDAAMDEVYS